MTDQPATYAIGDVHGEVTLLKQLLAMLPYREQDTLVFLGDCVNRGEDSIATVKTLQALKVNHPRCIFLRGNHEDAWLACWNGAQFTGTPDIGEAWKIRERWQGRVPFVLGDWLEETQIEYEDEHAYYLHAGALPGKPVWRTLGLQKMWGVPGFLESAYDWGKPIVFGHYPQEEPLLHRNKIGIDTGAYRSGILTAARLPDRQIFQARRA